MVQTPAVQKNRGNRHLTKTRSRHSQGKHSNSTFHHTQTKSVSWCFTPSQPVRLYQGEHRQRKMQVQTTVPEVVTNATKEYQP